MQTLSRHAGRVGAFVRRDFLITLSYPMAFFSDWINMVLQLAVFFFVGQLMDSTRLPTIGGVTISYIEFVAVGIAVASFVQIGLARIGSAVRREQLIGTLESLFVAPMPPALLQLGSAAYDLVYVPVRTVVFLGLVGLLFGVSLPLGGLLATALLLMLFVPVVWGLGLVTAGAALTFRQSSAAAGVGGALLTIPSGAYFPIDVLPPWVQPLAVYNPITIALDAARALLYGGGAWSELLPAAGAFLPMAAVTLTAGAVVFRLALRRERRRGTLGLY